MRYTSSIIGAVLLLSPKSTVRVLYTTVLNFFCEARVTVSK